MNRRGFFGALAGLAGALAFWKRDEVPRFHGIPVEYRAGQDKGPRYLWTRDWKGDQSQVRDATYHDERTYVDWTPADLPDAGKRIWAWYERRDDGWMYSREVPAGEWTRVPGSNYDQADIPECVIW